MHYNEIKVFREFGKAVLPKLWRWLQLQTHRWVLLLPARKIVLHKELLASSSWPFKRSVHKHALRDTCSGGTGARLRHCGRSSREGAQERPRTGADLLGGSAEHYLFRCNNTNLCGLFRSDKTKRIPKNAFPAWLPEPHCKHTVFAISSDGQKQNYCYLGPLSAELEQLFKLGKFYGAAECNRDVGNNTGTRWR